MNRIWDDSEDDKIHTKASVIHIRVSKDLSSGGPLHVGECPIVVDSYETAVEASQWGYTRSKELLMERGLDEEEAHQIADQFRQKQFEEMWATVRKDQAGPSASWN